MKNLFDQEGPVMRALTDLSTLVFLNILTMLCCIPVVTAGAALAAMHYVIMEMMEDRGGSLAPEYVRRFKQNLKNATPIWLILLAAAVFLYADYRIISDEKTGLPGGMLIPIYAGMFVLAAVYVYIIPLTARFVYSTGAVFMNAVILAAAYLPRTMPAYFCALLYMPVFRKMMGEKEEEEDRPWILEEPDGDGKAENTEDEQEDNKEDDQEESNK